MDELEQIVSLYDERVKRLGYDAKSVGWKSKDQQELRFRILTQNVELANQSIIDIGCGFGDLYDFLCTSGSVPLQYTGIDISNEVLKIARERYTNIPHVEFLNLQLMSKPDEVFDYAVASGSLNYNFPIDMNKYIENFISIYQGSVRKGLLINLLTTKVDYTQEIHVHYSPDYIETVFRKYFREVRVIENYGLYEFTIQALK
jgi:ubiquinone/menaquinone biosynthesis C-methylase UbiE